VHDYANALGETSAPTRSPPPWRVPPPSAPPAPPPAPVPPPPPEVDDLRHEAEPHSRFGIAGTAGFNRALTPTDWDVAFGAHVGLRFLVFPRTVWGWGFNLGVVLLGGVDIGSRVSLGLDARVEGVFMGKSFMAQPI